LSVSVKWLAVKTASEMTYCVSGGALNSTHSLTLVVLYFVDTKFKDYDSPLPLISYSAFCAQAGLTLTLKTANDTSALNW